VAEREVSLGALHTVQACPDAPFVVCIGGDKPDNNFKVLDVREMQAVRNTFGKRHLQNPLKTAEFGFAPAEEAEPGEDMETEAAAATLRSMTLAPEKPKVSGGAAGKFKKKEKKKKKNPF
jgi:hypothetical protein